MGQITDVTNYQWGSGMFKDIANIRRGVYTEYYVMIEHAETIREILGEKPGNHCQRLLRQIESPEFDIDSKNYEQIKAYLWREARLEFESQIGKWMETKSATFQIAGQELLRIVCECINTPLFNDGGMWRKAILLSTSLGLYDIMTSPNYAKLIHQILDAIDREGEPDGLITAIDFFDNFFHRVVQKPQKIVLLPGDISTLALDLKIYGECLISGWLEKSLLPFEGHFPPNNRPFQITLLVNENYCPRNNNKTIQRNATLSDVETALKFDGLEKLRKYCSAGLFNIRSFCSEFSGTVLSDLDKENLNLLHEADYVIALGEQNNLTVTGLPADCFRAFLIRDFSSIFYTGIKNNREEHQYPKLALIDVPAGIRPAIDYVPDLKTITDAMQYYQLYKSIPADKWRKLIEETQSHNLGNVFDAVQKTNVLNADERHKVALAIRSADARQLAQKYLDEFNGTYNCLTTQVDKYRTRAIYILHYPQGAINHKGERLDLGVLFANQIQNFRGRPKALMTYEDVSRNSSEALFGFNMLYFITRNIILKFNQVNPHFNLDETFFGEYIDFLKYPGKTGQLVYPSLYNKGAFGLKKDGTFEFGRIKLPNSGSVTIPVGDEKIPFTWTSVNPLCDYSTDISIFTPMEPKFVNPSLRAPHFVGSTRGLSMMPENDNFNFVFVNNILLGIVRGVTEIPPFGTILSVPPQMLPGNARKLLEEKAAYGKGKRLATKETHVSFDFPLDEKWADCEWVLGGGLLMVNEGKVESLDFEKDDSPASIYCIEGWDLETSQRTQETPVETNLNEARMTVGVTNNNEFFISVIDGRANNRTGATHQQTVDWIREYFDRQKTGIRFALDLDSASSVSLGVFCD